MPDPVPDSDLKRLLDAYDAQLREGAEMVSTVSFDRAGPLWRGKEGGRGFVSYRSLGGLTGPALDDLIAQTVAHYAADPDIQTFEWKTRGHDLPADLPQRLSAHGFQAQDVETVMVGEAALLAQPVPLPGGVTLRRIDDQPDPLPDVVRAAEAQEKAFGYGFGVSGYLRQIERNPDLFELWVAEAGGEVVCIGQLGVVPDSDFAGLWGGGTVPQWRGQGIYRALTSARAGSALRRGVRLLHSDCSEYSRPILERSGLVKITTTTPYIWTR